MPTQTITWTRITTGELTRYKVNKLVGKLSENTTFVWKAPIDSAITIFFPPYRDPLRIGTQTIPAGQQLIRQLPGDFKDLPTPNRSETYRYALYCETMGTFAEMSSDPEIIIDE